MRKNLVTIAMLFVLALAPVVSGGRVHSWTQGKGETHWTQSHKGETPWIIEKGRPWQ